MNTKLVKDAKMTWNLLLDEILEKWYSTDIFLGVFFENTYY